MFEIGYRFNEFRVAGVPGAASLGSIKFKVQCRMVGYGMVCIQLLQWIVRVLGLYCVVSVCSAVIAISFH